MREMIALLVLLSSAAQAAIVAGIVDLTAPGALDALRERRPDHYAKVQAILSVAATRPAQSASRWIEARGASDVELLQWRVSDPPKLQLSFTLDDTRYSAQVVPHLAPARAVPAR